jgi:hypothetical protein
MAALPAETASAQNLLESLFGGRTASAPALINTRTANPNAWDFIDKASTKTPAQGGSANSYCVRLCDGRFFPLPRKAVSAQMSSAQACSAMCPAAETRVYSGSAIERAVAKDGKPYASLKTAFLFREKSVDSCTCASGSLGSVAAMDVKDDPTLRRGDIVVTRDGPMVFTGTSRAKNREQAFVPAADYAGLPKNLRQQLAGMQIAQDPSETASLPVGVAPATLMSPVSVAQDVATTPVAEAFASFAR